MRAEFVEALTTRAERDERIVLLTGDLGFTVVEPFAERFPERFFNVGVAEQNMIGVATGLAEAGFEPFAYSIATFASMRPYEFIRHGPVGHDLPVRIVGVGGGFDYGHNGPSHFALEDVALMRAQPGLAVAVPADGRQAAGAVRALAAHPGPAYLRLARAASPIDELRDFELGALDVSGDGRDVAIVALGPTGGQALAAARLLDDRGVGCTVAAVTSFNPGPDDALAALLDEVPAALTAEGHYVTGGLGSYVCELVAERGLGCRVVRCGPSEPPRGVSGTTSYLDERHGLSPERLAEASLSVLGASRF